MAAANPTGVRSPADHPGRIAPVSTMSPADQSAHAAASFVRPFLSPTGTAALARLESVTAGWFPVAADGDYPSQEDEALRRVREHGNALRNGMAEYRAWAGSAAA